MLSKQITIDRAKVFYYVYNQELEPTIVALHGFRGNHKALTPFARSFKNHRVILLDLPGFGSSEPLNKNHDSKNYALFLDSFVTSLGLNKFFLWGHSLGGAIGIQYAAMFPDLINKLILVSPAISGKGLMEMIEFNYYKVTNLLPGKYRKLWVANRLFSRLSGELLIKGVSNKKKQALVDSGRRDLKEANPKVIVESALSYLEADLVGISKKIGVETLLIAGAVDIIVPVERVKLLKNSIKKSKLTIIPRHGHLTPLEKPSHVASITRQFIA